MVSKDWRGREGWKIKLQDETGEPRSEREGECAASESEPAGVML